MTDGERRLWNELRQFRRLYGVHVRRQVPIGPYVADFAVHEQRLVIELDGEHLFSPEATRRDARRDDWLHSEGYRVVRMNTGELSDNFDGCVTGVLDALGLMGDALTPTPYPSPQGGGETSKPRRTSRGRTGFADPNAAAGDPPPLVGRGEGWGYELPPAPVSHTDLPPKATAP